MVRAHFGQSNFPFFQQKRKKEILLILFIFTYFKVQTKIEKKKMVRKIDHFFIFLIFELPPLFPYQFSRLLSPPPPRILSNILHFHGRYGTVFPPLSSTVDYQQLKPSGKWRKVNQLQKRMELSPHLEN